MEENFRLYLLHTNNEEGVLIVELLTDTYYANILSFNQIEKIRAQRIQAPPHYFYQKNLLLVPTVTKALLQKVTKGLLATGDFFEVMQRL